MLKQGLLLPRCKLLAKNKKEYEIQPLYLRNALDQQ